MKQQFNSIFNVTIFVTLINFITSCGGYDERIGSDYLPIDVGNLWTFIDPENPRDSYTISIIGTTKLSNGKPAFIATASDREKGYLSKAAADLILFHQAINDLQGELIYSPPIKVGTTWQGSQGEAEVVAQEIVNSPAGIFQDCFRINVSVVDDNAYYSIWLANNVGPVKLAKIDVSDGEIEATMSLETFYTR